MKVLDASAFNETVLKEIEQVKNTVDNNITSENIKYFPISAMSTYRDSIANQKGGNQEETFPAWDYNSNVNSMELSRIRTAINYLKSFKTKVITEKFEFNPYAAMQGTNITDKTDVKYQYKIKVPDNFDGRNAFVEYTISSFFLSGSKGALNENDRSAASAVFWKPEDFCCLWGNQMAQTGSHCMSSIKIYRNKNEIIIDVRFPMADVKSTADSFVLLDHQNVWLKGRVTMWRLS